MRRDLDRATPHAQALLDLGLPTVCRVGTGSRSLLWPGLHAGTIRRRSRKCAPHRRLLREIDFRRRATALRHPLAEAEAAGGRIGRRSATVDGATRGDRADRRTLVRCRSASRPRRNSAQARSDEHAPAEEAFLTAIAIAQEQKAQSFELHAALSLAKLYQSTNRAADAHAVLAPASRAFRRRRNFPRSRRRKRCSPLLLKPTK